MSDRYTMRELTAALGVDGNTARSWLEALGVEPQPSRRDARIKYVSAVDAQRVAEAHERELLPIPIELPKTLVGAHRLILLLEAEIAELRRERDEARASAQKPMQRAYMPDLTAQSSIGVSDRAGPVESHPARPQGHITYSSAQGQPHQRGLGKRYAAKVALAHGSRTFDASRSWQWTDEALETEAGIVAFIRAWLMSHNAGDWRECERSDCPCHTQLIEG